MKNLNSHKNQLFSIFLLILTFYFFSCSPKQISKFEVQRPAKISIPRDVKKVFIRQDMVKNINDKLSIKTKLLEALAEKLNKLGRFEAQVIKKFNINDFDPEKETVGIIQGEVTSGGEIDRGQFTDLATCTGGIKGRISSLGASSISREEITIDNWRGYICRKSTFKSDLSEIALSSAFKLAGLAEGFPPKNEVVRTYRYKNLSLFSQTNFILTIIGQTRSTLAIRSDSTSFGSSIKEKGSFRNVQESHLISNTLGALVSLTKFPIFPIPNREIALAKLSNPKNKFYSKKNLPVPKNYDFAPGEKKIIIEKLINGTIDSFINTISPYKVLVEAQISAGGKANVKEFLINGNSKKAIEIIESIPEKQREEEDWYNLGLAYEASAISIEDYENARRYYINALEINPSEQIYAQGIGRCYRYLLEIKKLNKQIKN